jgi:hypothetical protein
VVQHSQRLCVTAPAEAGAVVGHDAKDPDAVIAKEAQGIEEELQAGAPRFVGQDLKIGQPRVIIDGQMEIFPPFSTFLAAAWRTLSGTVFGDAMPDLFDAAEHFDVDMDHLARVLFS